MIANILLAFLAFVGCAQAQESLTDRAVKILDTIQYKSSFHSVITENEWRELQLDRLLPILDRTKTSFGRWGLRYLLHPIADVHQITERQKIVSFLIEHEDVLLDVQQQLSVVHEHEKSLLSYWDKEDKVNASCDQFYYTMPLIKTYLNNSALALNTGIATSMMTSLRGLFFSLCLSGVSEEFNDWLMIDNKKDFKFLRGIKRGLEQPLRQHSFALDILKNHDAPNGYDLKDYMRVMLAGSFGDRYNLLSQGYSVDATTIGLPSSLFQSDVMHISDIAGKCFAFLGAGMQTVMYDYVWGMTLYGIGQHIIKMNQSLNQLQCRVSDVALCCNAIIRVHDNVKQYSFFSDRCALSSQLNEQLSQCLKQLSSKRFADKYTFLYSRGHVLSMHAEIKKIKKHMLPLFHSIALIDAYCSIAQLYKEGQGRKNTFSFVQFADAQQPFISYEDAWLVLLPSEQAVSNDLSLGNDHAGKVVVTGPNGGGKSTILKTCGVSAVLAQSWGIVPAVSAQQTIFNEIKTVFVSSENLEQGLSTFMAAKKRMQEMYPVVQQSHQHNHVLALIDEPYIGTVDEESAKRIYHFGKTVAQYPCTLMYIATHVKKPVSLALDTPGVFANYHVEINEKSVGNFELSFLLKKGPAGWWFEDEEKRGRFVDWISTDSAEKSAKKDIFSIDGLSSLLYS
jgi:energy-coupling factor transporter ATP-binding protein EcfA2